MIRHYLRDISVLTIPSIYPTKPHHLIRFPARIQSENKIPWPAKNTTVLASANDFLSPTTYSRLYRPRLTKYARLSEFSTNLLTPATLPATTAAAKKPTFSRPLACAASARTMRSRSEVVRVVSAVARAAQARGRSKSMGFEVVVV